MMENKLYRSRTDRKVFGLCGGIGQWLGVDATVIRLALILLTLFSGGSILLFYFLASIVVPKDPYIGHIYGMNMNV